MRITLDCSSRHTRNVGQATITVDMDAEKGRQPNPQRPNKFRMQVRQVKALGLQGLMAYMNNQADFTVECLEAINFLDHLMRELPSRRLYSIKRSFFDKPMKDSQKLGAAVTAVKGVYQSIRPAMVSDCCSQSFSTTNGYRVVLS